jgi:hypothetical protein
MNLTPRQRVDLALKGEVGPSVPFSMYECMIPQCTMERQLRNRGLCIIQRTVPVFTTHTPNVNVVAHSYWENGRRLVHTEFDTPKGTLSTLHEPAGFTDWYHERMFKSPEDYAAIRFLVEDEVYTPNYEDFSRAQAAFGEDALFRADIDYEPFQALISANYLSTQSFCFEWMDHRDELLRLYETLVKKRRQVYPIIAQSPATYVNYGGNVVPEIVSPVNFKKYYVPDYNEAAAILHEHGKRIGSHFDGNCRAFAEAIAGSDLDYVEAFTPYPDTDMTLGEARAAWPDKALWFNFTSSVHLQPDAVVEQVMVELLNQLPSPRGVVVSITEDMPPDRWQNSCKAIMDGLDRHARENPSLYNPDN